MDIRRSWLEYLYKYQNESDGTGLGRGLGMFDAVFVYLHMP